MSWVNNSILFRSLGMVNTVRRSKVLAALLFLVTGILFLAKPEGDMTLTVMYVLGLLVVVALLDVLIFFLTKDRHKVSFLLLIVDALIVIGGIILMFHRDFLATALPYVMGVGSILNGIMNLSQSLWVEKEKSWKLVLTIVLALLSMGVGVTLLVRASEASRLMKQTMGGLLIIDAITDLWVMLQMSMAVKKAKN